MSNPFSFRAFAEAHSWPTDAQREPLKHPQQELEAGSLANLVSERPDVTSKSESQLPAYIAANTTVGTLDLDTRWKRCSASPLRPVRAENETRVESVAQTRSTASTRDSTPDLFDAHGRPASNP